MSHSLILALSVALVAATPVGQAQGKPIPTLTQAVLCVKFCKGGHG
jgi:hypothetical protein